jgi:hypothetical protein
VRDEAGGAPPALPAPLLSAYLACAARTYAALAVQAAAAAAAAAGSSPTAAATSPAEPERAEAAAGLI